MKKIILSLLVAVIAFGSLQAAPVVSDKVLKIFNESFPKAQNPSWYEYDTYSEVYFSNEDNSKCRIRYDQDGKIISTRRDYDGTMLSPFIQSKVKDKYGDKKIFGVTEITSDEGLAYHIVLEDDKHWYNITSDATGQLSMDKKLNKSK